MGISSLGAGSSILTQDVIDQLKAADEAKFVAPVDARIKTEETKLAAYEAIDALVDNVYKSLKSLNEYGVFEARNTSVSDEDALEVIVKASSDIQDFSLEIEKLATKEIEQSASFDKKDATIAAGSGKLELLVGTQKFTISYDATTTLDGLKNLINKSAGDSVNATVIQVADGDFKLLINAKKTGEDQEISITDVVGEGEALSDKLTSQMTNIQDAQDALFKFNGVSITRSTNTIDDLLSGVTLNLKEADIGKVIDVSVKQNTEHIEEKITNFVDKYNSAIFQLNEDTKSSQDKSQRGIFSSDSTIKGMKSSLENMLSIVGGASGKLAEFGIELDKDGRLSLDAEVLNNQLADNSANVQAFFVGGDFKNENGSTTKMTGAFVELEDKVAKYSKYNAILDQFKTSMTTRSESLTQQREKAVERLESSYAIMSKRFAAYDLIISKFNTASSMFSQMINAEIAAKG